MKGLHYASVIVVCLAAAAVVFRFCVIKIAPGQIGVLTKEWGGGLQQEDYPPGYYLNLGPLHTWNVMDTTVQTLDFLRSTPGKVSRVSYNTQRYNALNVKSSDGADVALDITVKYQIEPGQSWRVFSEKGGLEGYKGIVRTTTEDVLRLELGRLTTENFFDPDKRTQTQQQMMDTLRPKLLDDIQVNLVAILIRDLSFQETFEARIKAKTLTVQEAEVEIAEKVAAVALGETNRIRAETEAKVQVIGETLQKTLTEMRAENDKSIQRVIADYEKYVTESRSEAELYGAQKEAAGIELLRTAEAKGEALRRAALSNGGGNTLVALRAVENLQLGDLMLSTQLVNPLDFDAMMARFGIK